MKRELSIGQDPLGRLENLYQHGLALLTSAERTKKHAARIGYLRELRGILGAFYEVAREASPQSMPGKALPEAFIAAISHALGVTGKLEPIGVLPGSTADVLDLDILPQDSAEMLTTEQ